MRLIAFSRAPALVAAFERGLFAAEGIDVSVTHAASSTSQLDALLAGDQDVAHTAADNVVARVDRGADLRVILVIDRGIEHRLIGAPHLTRLEDVAGRVLGVDSPESGHALVAYALLAEAGVPRDRYRVVPVGGTAERYVPLIEGRIDATMLSAPHDARALAAGCHLLADAPARFPYLPGLTVAVRGVWAAANADSVTRYCRALLAGARWSAEHGTGDARGMRPLTRSIAEMSDAVREAIALRRTVGLATAESPVSRYFDPAYAVAAMAPLR